MEEQLKVGDLVFHKSNYTITWVVEEIKDREVGCSTIVAETLEQKKLTFLASSVEKKKTPVFRERSPRRSSYYL
ncbi:hypothetical protein [Taibaiella chishuiensis]|uniref:DUF2158 domain-containing protein n=1 Tax=Taibaiella chishuiensis TaxID=1434707 RepID=A0A2P8D0J5_9BACT|nr:hypothetical protein [Taibaiella chishuiensis]PSK90740.1 hypothetical protein B0I18_107150 [Taibaiella chishuiensis]